MNFVQQYQFRPSPLPKQQSPYINNFSVASTLVQIKSVENSPNSKTVSTLTFNSPESPTMRLGGNSFTNSSRAQLWTLALYNNKNSSFLMRSDKDIDLVSLDLPNQNVLNNDCLRTRVNSFTPSLRASLEKLLTCYCKRENITYKQGLHELAAPFVLFLESGISLSETYNLFSLFIDKFLPSFYTDQDFLSLQCCQRALSLLLKYHDPTLHAFLTSNYFTPEIFSTPWFLTLFSSKLELNIVYLLWDLYLVEQDPYFVFFLAVGLLIENRHTIMNSSISIVPEILSNLTIENREQLKQIYKRAKTLKLNTLQSFTQKLEELEILKRGYAQDKNYKSKLHQSLDYLENLTHIVISPYELLQALYPVELGCANPNCTNLTGNKKDLTPSSRKNSSQNIEFNKGFESDSPFWCTGCVTKSSSSSRFILEKSMPHLSDILKEKGSYQIQDGSQTYHINFVIMDLRASKEIGYLPRSHLIEPSRLKPGAINQSIDEFARLKGQSHFILMTSRLDNNFFASKKSEGSGDQGYGAFKQQINMNDENSLAAQFLAALTKKGFPYLTIVDGGFQRVNQILNNRCIELLKSSPWTPKSIFKADSIASTEPYYLSGSPKAGGSHHDLRSTFNDIPSSHSNASRNFDTYQENLQSASPLNRPKTPTPSSAVFISARQEPSENTFDIQARSKSTMKNQRKIDQPLNSKIDFHTPKTPDPFQSKLGFSGQYEAIGHNVFSRASTEASPEKIRLKSTLSTPSFLASQGITSAVRTISSPGAGGAGFNSPKMKDSMGYEENPIRASREIFSQQKSKLIANRDMYDEPGSAGLPESVKSPLVMSEHQKSSRSAIVSPAYNTPSQNSPTHHGYRDPMRVALPRGTQIPISDFSNLIKYQSSLTFSNNFGELGSGKVQINNFERDQDFTKSAYANKEMNSIGDYMNDRKYFNGNSGDIGNSRFGSERDSRNTSVYSVQDYKYSSFAQANETRLNREPTPEQRSPLLQIPKDYKEYKDFALDNKEDEGERKSSTSPMKRTQKSVTSVPQKLNATNGNNKSMSGKVQNNYPYDDKEGMAKSFKGDNRQFYEIGNPERAIIMANEMLRKKEEASGDGREKIKKRDSDSGLSPSKVHYYPEADYQKQYQSGSTGIINSYLSQQQNSVVSSKRSIVAYGSQSSKNLTILSPRAVLPDDELHFYKYFQKKNFTLYICEHLQKVAEDRGGLEDNQERSILVISQELVVTIQFNQNIFQKLILLQKGVPATQLMQTYQKDRQSNYVPQSQRDLSISSVLPLRLLLKVTSKKADPKFISIYFKFPKIEEECFRRFYRMFDMANMTLEELFRTAENKEFEYVLDEVRSQKDEKKFTEIKSVYKLENEETAQKCILRVKEAYKKYPTNY